MCPEGAEAAEVRHGRCQSLRRQTTEGALNDWILDSQARGNTSLVPRRRRATGLLLHHYFRFLFNAANCHSDRDAIGNDSNDGGAEHFDASGHANRAEGVGHCITWRDWRASLWDTSPTCPGRGAVIVYGQVGDVSRKGAAACLWDTSPVEFQIPSYFD